MGALPALGYGAVGALIVYLAMFRQRRLKIFLEAPKKEWRVLLFDFTIYIVLGALVTAFLASPATVKEAVAIGGMWEGIVGSVMPTQEK